MAVLTLTACLAGLDETTPSREAWVRVRDEVIVGLFGGRPGFGDGLEEDEHRFRIDDHWPR